MKKLLLAAAIAAAFSGAQTSLADTLRVTNGANQTFDIDLSSFQYNSATGRLTVTTTANVVVDSGGGNSGGGDTPGGGNNGDDDPVGGDNGGGNDGGEGPIGGGADGACNIGVVKCNYHVADWPNEISRAISIPKGEIVSSKFTTSKDGMKYGGLYYEAQATGGGYVGIDAWISETPGSLTPVGNSSFCISTNASYIFNLKWIEDGRTGPLRCVLKKNTTYYLNLKHNKASTNQSTVYRFIK